MSEDLEVNQRVSELSTFTDLAHFAGGTGLTSHTLECFDDIMAFNNFTEDNVLVVEPGANHEGDEELAAVGAGSGVGHGQEHGLGVLVVEVLVFELAAVDGFAASAVAEGEVATLGHEAADNSVEFASLEVKGFA